MSVGFYVYPLSCSQPLQVVQAQVHAPPRLGLIQYPAGIEPERRRRRTSRYSLVVVGHCTGTAPRQRRGTRHETLDQCPRLVKNPPALGTPTTPEKKEKISCYTTAEAVCCVSSFTPPCTLHSSSSTCDISPVHITGRAGDARCNVSRRVSPPFSRCRLAPIREEEEWIAASAAQ